MLYSVHFYTTFVALIFTLGVDKTGETIALDNEGWYYSGDLCRMDEDGYIKITGRKKDIIIRGGENISSR
ncbi:AMP-binding protein, partial [Salmonella enterica subsp. enterica serovar Virginia]|nr:AMP-binding protein [Salmonella enterica subsp. enterica serovar Virginia]